MEPDLGGLEGLLLGAVSFFFSPKILSIENCHAMQAFLNLREAQCSKILSEAAFSISRQPILTSHKGQIKP